MRNAPSSSALAARLVEASSSVHPGGSGVSSAVDGDTALYFGHAPPPGHMLSRSAFLTVHRIPPQELIANQRNRSHQPPAHNVAFDNLFDSHGKWVESAVPPSDDLQRLLQLSNDSGAFTRPAAKWMDTTSSAE
jgi:hypothetical protein